MFLTNILRMRALVIISQPMQTTLNAPIVVSGIGLHSGSYITATLHPAECDHGICFHRTDISGQNAIIPARTENAIETPLCTRIENDAGIKVNTVEHFMAAFHGLGIDNVRIDVDGPELPILDGSALQIVDRIQRQGLCIQAKPRRTLIIKKTVEVSLDNGATARLEPADSLILDVSIDFDDPAIGRQHLQYHHDDGQFVTDLASARTFCLYKHVEMMRQAGLAQGGSLENAVVVDEGHIMNPDGLRMADEFVRHKALDCLGDLYLLGMTLRGKLSTSRPGHALSTKLLKALMADTDAFEIMDWSSAVMLGGHGQKPDAAVASQTA